MADIYEQIWNHSGSHVTVSLPGNGSGTQADVVVDEQGKRQEGMWFEPYTNRFGETEPFCVGFEHIFVGETSNPRHCEDTVGGYHSWVKYYLDQKAGKVSYLGHDYRNDVASAGLADPNVATVVMTWTPDEDEGGTGDEQMKKPGGFFVGTRPECEMALGTVGLFEVLADRFRTQGNPEDHRRVRLGSSTFDLVLHPETVRRSPMQRGDHIRTFYPKFRSGAGAEAGTGETGRLPTQPHNDGAIRIVRSLPNPPGDDQQGEWVEIRNVNPEGLDLTGWRLVDQHQRGQELSGTIASGETLRIDVTRDDPQSLQLSNSGGWIMLFEGAERRAAVQYGRAREGVIVEFL